MSPNLRVFPKFFMIAIWRPDYELQINSKSQTNQLWGTSYHLKLMSCGEKQKT